MKITAETKIKGLIEKHPEVIEILMAYGLQCVNCHFSEFDTLEDAAKIHGLNGEDIKMVIKDSNKTIKRSKNEKRI